MSEEEDKSQKVSIQQSGWKVHVEGDFIQAGRDVHLGERVNKQDLIRELEELRRMIADLPALEFERREDVKRDVDAVIRETKRDSPEKNLIARRLDTVKETLSAAAGTAGEVEKVIKLIGKVTKWAMAILL